MGWFLGRRYSLVEYRNEPCVLGFAGTQQEREVGVKGVACVPASLPVCQPPAGADHPRGLLWQRGGLLGGDFMCPLPTKTR